MDQQEYTTLHQKGKHLTYEERVIIEVRLKDGWSIKRIAEAIGCSPNTIRNELKRGMVLCYKQCYRYKASEGQRIYDLNRISCHRKYKIYANYKCREFVKYVEHCFSVKGWSLDASVGRYKLQNKGKYLPEDIVSTGTLYNYTDKGIITIKNIDLPEKLRRKKRRFGNRINKHILGHSIEQRPDISKRELFGDWEIDSIIGKKAVNHEIVTTLCERKTGYAIDIKSTSKTSSEVLKTMQGIMEYYGRYFSKIFRSITSDNGMEFAELGKIEQESCGRTKIYFTHPYSAWERGINERHNRMLRQYIPKGKDIGKYSKEDISYMADRINNLPRKRFGYRTPQELFDEELDKIYAIR